MQTESIQCWNKYVYLTEFDNWRVLHVMKLWRDNLTKNQLIILDQQAMCI